MSAPFRQAPSSREALIRRIEALRRARGDDPDATGATPAACRGVSGRNVDATVQAAAGLGISRRALQEGLAFDLGAAGASDAWVSWEDFGALLGRIGALRGEEGLGRLGEQALQSPLFRAIGVGAGAFFDERDLYQWILRLVFREDGLYFSGVDGRIEVHGPRRLRVVFESRGAVYSRPFAAAMAGIVRSVPRLVGRRPAEVAFDVTPARMTLDVQLAARVGGGSLVRRVAHLVGLPDPGDDAETIHGLYTELVETNRLLSEKLEALEASRAARQQMEEHLTRVRQMQAVGRFAGAVAHDFNNLLTVVVSVSGLLRDGTEAGCEARRHLDVIDDVARRATDLTKELRGLGPAAPNTAPTVDVRRLVARAEPMLRSLAGSDVSLRSELGDAPLGARIEPASLERVLANLVTNARESMGGPGHVWIRVRPVELDGAFTSRHPGASEGPHVEVRVTDDGPGMPEAVRVRVFEPFFSTKAPSDGRGLGLATVFGLVAAADGTVWVDSAPGEGATFRIYLPHLAIEARP
ncbi:MAG TPA: ATP-binding protein, partial [Sandaracinaceae bacterium LLY-WYZ-13_1]|nr:ATP-binding protein [Sandaracinaceae bacterium LLY-WYZ-13_1]